jgi:hypothetical protein
MTRRQSSGGAPAHQGLSKPLRLVGQSSQLGDQRSGSPFGVVEVSDEPQGLLPVVPLG